MKQKPKQKSESTMRYITARLTGEEYERVDTCSCDCSLSHSEFAREAMRDLCDKVEKNKEENRKHDNRRG